jgi:hypothetical protein
MARRCPLLRLLLLPLVLTLALAAAPLAVLAAEAQVVGDYWLQGRASWCVRACVRTCACVRACVCRMHVRVAARGRMACMRRHMYATSSCCCRSQHNTHALTHLRTHHTTRHLQVRKRGGVGGALDPVSRWRPLRLW